MFEAICEHLDYATNKGNSFSSIKRTKLTVKNQILNNKIFRQLASTALLHTKQVNSFLCHFQVTFNQQ